MIVSASTKVVTRRSLMVMIDLANHDDGGYVSLMDISGRQTIDEYLGNVVSIAQRWYA